MKTNKQRLRIAWEPLSLTCCIENFNSEPLSQIFNSTDRLYEPDRKATPLMLFPRISAKVSDGTWDNGLANGRLAGVKWYENGEEISVRNTNYHIIRTAGTNFNTTETETVDMQGLIVVYRNVSEAEVVELTFEAYVVDETGRRSPQKITGQPILLTTVATPIDKFSMSLTRSSIKYNVLYDHLLEYNYKCAKQSEWEFLKEGKHNSKAATLLKRYPFVENFVPSNSARIQAQTSGSPYLVPVGISCYRNDEELSPDQYDINAYIVEGESKTDLSESLMVHSISTSEIVFDLRFLDEDKDKADVVIHCIPKVAAIKNLPEGVDLSDVVPHKALSIAREMARVDVNIENRADVATTSSVYVNHLTATHKGGTLSTPEAQLELEWLTDHPLTGNPVSHGTGEYADIDLVAAGLDSAEDDGIDLYVDYNIKRNLATVIMDEDYRIITGHEGRSITI